MGFLDLPQELVERIATSDALKNLWREHHDDQGEHDGHTPVLGEQDLTFLARTCKDVYCIVNPILYKYNKAYNGSSVVHWATRLNRLETLRWCSGLNLQSPAMWQVFRDCNYQFQVIHDTPITTAIKLEWRERHDMIKWFLDNGASVDDTSKCYHCGFCLQERLHLNQAPTMWSLLHLALCWGKAEAALLLISRGASLEFQQHERVRRSRPMPVIDIKLNALHTAAERSMREVIAHLACNRMVDVNVTDSVGWNPLHYAVRVPDNSETIRDLLKLGANIIHEAEGISLLRAAIEKGYFSNAATLVNAGTELALGPRLDLSAFPIHLYTLPNEVYMSEAQLSLRQSDAYKAWIQHEMCRSKLASRQFMTLVEIPLSDVHKRQLLRCVISLGRIEAAMELVSQRLLERWPRGADKNDLLILAVRSGSFEMVKRLVQEGVPAYGVGSEDETPSSVEQLNGVPLSYLSS
ncbi:ankyrin repeat-containing domain protein [Xylariales sp. AK1849]|nr:ankyrin repeat-containing domain protein [Xylariales sp. AK1849]